MSVSLRLDGVSFSFGDRPLLDRAHLHLSPGWTGLVGPNGAGKSTLLRILDGTLAVSGRTPEPPELRILRVQQGIEAPSERVQAFAAAWDRAALRWFSLLELPEDGVARWNTLSPGQRRRFQVAAALWARPQVLLLDEPDNHLDLEARERLVEALAHFDGIGVVVSHDRALLDTLSTQTVRLHRARLEALPLPWSQAAEVWEADAERARSLHEATDAQRRKAQRRAQQARQQLEAASRAKSRRRVNAKDGDARSSARKGRLAKAEAAHAKRYRQQRAALARAEAQSVDLERPSALGAALTLPSDNPRRRTLLELRIPRLMGGPKLLAEDLDLRLERGDKVWLRGPNGSGKSTLLRALLQATALPPERVALLPQELGQAEIQGLLARLDALPSQDKGAVLQLLAALGVPPTQVLQTQAPSAGEARKLALALTLGQTLGRQPWIWVLDEPTHHLDLPARLALQSALRRFEGALLLVTHDQALGQAVCTQTWTLGASKLTQD